MTNEARKQYGSFEEYSAAWLAAARAAGHVLREEGGDVDLFVVSGGFHNGPGCSRCHESWCYHCTPPEKIGQCEGDLPEPQTADQREITRLRALLDEAGKAINGLLSGNGRKEGGDGYCIWWTEAHEGKTAERFAIAVAAKIMKEGK